MPRIVVLAVISGALTLSVAMGRAPRDKKEGGAMEDVAKLAATEASPSFWRGAQSGVSKPDIRVVKEEKAWAALWKEEFNTEAPKVDFSRYFAVAVFLGLRNTGGYGVEFLTPVAEKGKVRIAYRVKSPGTGSFVIQAFTQPYAIQLYRKTPLEVTVEKGG